MRLPKHLQVFFCNLAALNEFAQLREGALMLVA